MNLRTQKLIDGLMDGWPSRSAALARLGIDLVHIPRIEESMRRFGPRFAARLFSDAEVAYAQAAPAQAAQRLAARFAAKEAAIKALGLAERGVSWRDMEVVREADGSCTLALHGRALDVARERGVSSALVSLSHDGEYAAAVVAVLSDRAQLHP
jgi:holo-[acyl-carrier protein] synthase